MTAGPQGPKTKGRRSQTAATGTRAQSQAHEQSERFSNGAGCGSCYNVQQSSEAGTNFRPPRPLAAHGCFGLALALLVLGALARLVDEHPVYLWMVGPFSRLGRFLGALELT